MDNPFGLLTFIVAPAILTNASSVMALNTANRFARTIDRARSLANYLEGKSADTTSDFARRRIQLGAAERRARMLVSALTAFYLSVGSFAAASLLSLLSAVLYALGSQLPHLTFLGLGFAAGTVGVCGLVAGSGLLVLETRLTLQVLRERSVEP